MSFNRIQKLLFSEYRDFEDMVLVESPFAQTTRDGEGVRQVHIGLTPTKLVLAVDVLPPADEVSIFCDPDVDPIIESMELIAIYPVECVNLSVFRRRRRQSLKAHFCNNRISYFELGGFEKRTMFWNLWCERVKFLCPDDDKSTKSETSAATSTSYSTLHLVESNCKVSENGKHQLWLKYGRGEYKSKCKFPYSIVDQAALEQGFEFIPEDENDNRITEYKNTKSSSQFMILNTDTSESKTNQNKLETSSGNQSSGTIYENENVSDATTTSTEAVVIKLSALNSEHMERISESAVKDWEQSKSNTLTKVRGTRGRHPRRYAFSPQPHFLNGLGPWNLHTGDRYSVQMKRSVSAVRIRRQPSDADLCLPISKRLLTVSISCEAFHIDPDMNISGGLSKLMTPETPLLYFWTPEYWYRPQPARDAYLEFVQHKNKIRNYLDSKKKSKKKRLSLQKQLIEDAREFEKIFDNSQNFNRTANGNNTNGTNPMHLTSIQILRQILKMKVASRAWDFDSTCLAYQLTMIDKELFLKITEPELQVIVWQHTSKNVPNIGSIIAFSHRITCLVATEILREEQVRMRARLVVRFISVASKCERLNNHQSCISVLNGLQSPPVYRLHSTWAHLRKYHSMKYLLFETLCRQCSDARLPHYQKIFYMASRKPPFLPYIGDILAKLLDKSIQLSVKELKKYEENVNYSILQDNIKDFNRLLALRMEQTKMHNTYRIKSTSGIYNPSNTKTNKIINFFSNMKIWKSNNGTDRKTKEHSEHKENKRTTMEMHGILNKKRNKMKHHQFFDYCKDNRLQCLADATDFTRVCQAAATKYALSTDQLAKEYLLKARYREEKENFFNSFKLESKITYNS